MEMEYDIAWLGIIFLIVSIWAASLTSSWRWEKMEEETVRELRASGDAAIEKCYDLSSDWGFLKEILETTPVFAMIDNRGFREPVVVRKWINGEYRASVSGYGYIEEPWERFVQQAEKYNLKFAIPHFF